MILTVRCKVLADMLDEICVVCYFLIGRWRNAGRKKNHLIARFLSFQPSHSPNTSYPSVSHSLSMGVSLSRCTPSLYYLFSLLLYYFNAVCFPLFLIYRSTRALWNEGIDSLVVVALDCVTRDRRDLRLWVKNRVDVDFNRPNKGPLLRYRF